MDLRIKKLGRILAEYSLNVQKGEVVEISGNAVAEPLFVAAYEAILARGAFPEARMTPEGCTEAFFTKGMETHFSTLTAYQRGLVNNVDKTVRIIATRNTRALSAVDPAKQAQWQKTIHPVRKILLKKPWVLTLFPTEAFAQDAEMSLQDFEDFVYHAVFADEEDPIACWKQLADHQSELIARLKGASQVRIVGPETDISMSVKGRTFINSAGTHNMPSGEIFTSPVEASVEGHICYDYPVCHAGREIHGIRLVFQKGQIVEATADKNQDYLLQMLDMDPGARRLGELGIGTNMNIQQFTKNILFDEKIGGSIHLAVGDAFPEAGGKNKSALHWDMIKDLRRGGAIYVDGKVFQKDGTFSQP
ncbi:MAG: aminopeptidase [Spartobacteria bacterium]|nr:aminopeptidase [Spartobacteria bacterium]